MGNVDCLRNKVEPFTALFWTLGIVLYLSTPDPARRPGITLPPYTNHVMLPVRWWRVGSILNQDALLPSTFPIYSRIIFIYGYSTVQCTRYSNIQ